MITRIVCLLLSSAQFIAALQQTRIKSLQPPKDEIPTLTVCEVLSHPSEYDGKIVRIRDRVFGTDEGAGFIGESCPGIYVTDGKIWPSQIAWTMPTDLTFILHKVDFQFDWQSGKALNKKYRALRKRVPDRCLEYTYTGMFESWSKQTAKKIDLKGRQYEIPGFGHLNESPAQLVLKSADDITPSANCKR
jgi:hypothetical protein